MDLTESGDYAVIVNNYSGIVGAYTLTVWITSTSGSAGVATDR